MTAMKRITLFVFALMLAIACRAQQNQPKDTPQLEFALQLRVTLGETYSVGETQLLKGTILNGGADYQLANTALNRTELEAIYSIKTDDGVYIHVRNRGIICGGKDENGNPTFYFRAAPQFEAPSDSPYAWMNNALFVCAPEWSQGFQGIVLNVWKVK